MVIYHSYVSLPEGNSSLRKITMLNWSCINGSCRCVKLRDTTVRRANKRNHQSWNCNNPHCKRWSHQNIPLLSMIIMISPRSIGTLSHDVHTFQGRLYHIFSNGFSHPRSQILVIPLAQRNSPSEVFHSRCIPNISIGRFHGEYHEKKGPVWKSCVYRIPPNCTFHRENDEEYQWI